MSLIELYPTAGGARALRGLYLAEPLPRSNRAGQPPFIFTNYIASLDGRIAIPHHSRPGMKVPEAIVNDRDWRLFQELRAQSDLLITSGRYLRDVVDGRAQENLQIYQNPEFADLGQWRQAAGLAAEPDLAVLSASLNFEVPPSTVAAGRKLWVFTTDEADPERADRIAQQGGIIVRAGSGQVDGQVLAASLGDSGYRTVFGTAGPKVFHTLLAAGRIDRLYLTLAHRLLAGAPFSSILEGPLIDPPADLQLKSLYLDQTSPGAGGQMYAIYDVD